MKDNIMKRIKSIGLYYNVIMLNYMKQNQIDKKKYKEVVTSSEI